MLGKDDLQKLKASLFAGKYNLLLGAGISLDSFDSDEKPLPSAWSLQKEICDLKGVSTDRPLTKVYPLLNEDERDRLLTKRFARTIPGKTVKQIPHFLWKQIFTFNIDDALEAAYEENKERKQTAKPTNYRAPRITADSGGVGEAQT